MKKSDLTLVIQQVVWQYQETYSESLGVGFGLGAVKSKQRAGEVAANLLRQLLIPLGVSLEIEDG